MANRWLAWTLRLVTDVALMAWLVLMAYVLILMAQQRLPGGDGIRQGSIYAEVSLPADIVEVASPDVSVVSFEASQTRIHYRTTQESSVWQTAQTLGRVVIWWGVFALILWPFRQVVSSFVRRQPLTLDNARRFRIITYLLVFHVAATSLAQSLQYRRLQLLFPMLPARGFVDLCIDHLEWSRLFFALLILLLAEAVRLGTEHRLDSEAVV